MSGYDIDHPGEFDIVSTRPIDADHLRRIESLVPEAQREIIGNAYRRFLQSINQYDESDHRDAWDLGPSSQKVPASIYPVRFILENALLPGGAAVLESLNDESISNQDNCVRWLANDQLLVEMRIYYERLDDPFTDYSSLIQCWEGELFFAEDAAELRDFAAQRTPLRLYKEYGEVIRRAGGGDIVQSIAFPGFREYGEAVQAEDQAKLTHAVENLRNSSLACSHVIDPLWQAMQINRTYIGARVQELMDANIPWRSESLHSAVITSYFPQIVKIMSVAGADLNCLSTRGDTLLHAAVRANNAPAVEALLLCGVDQSLLDARLLTAREVALCETHSPAITSLFDAIAAKQKIQETIKNALGRSAANLFSHP